MKVIFVIQGEGRGHLTQALALKQMLLHEGHEVVKVLVGKSKNRVIPEFFMNQIDSPVELFDSPNFLPSKDNRRFNLLRSLTYNTLLTPSYLSSIHLIRKNIQESGADIIINFYEVLCGITCSLFRFGIPEVCIGHQYLFLHPSFQMPGKYPVPESLLKFFTRITCMGATAKLALSIRDYEDDPVHGIKVVPPLLRQEAKTIIRHHGDYIMGYMLNAGFAEDVKAWHEKHPHTRLHFFWDQQDAPEELKVDDTLSFHRINDEKFLKMMAGCKAFFLITCDHGRGESLGVHANRGEVDSKASWAEHGRRIKGSNQTWLVAFGKDILHLGEMEGGRTIYTKQVAPTIASILKVPFTNDDNQQPEASPIYKILK